MFAGQQQPQQVPPAVQQQRMQAYPAQMKQVAMAGAPPLGPGQFRGPPVEETVQPPPPKKKRKPTKKQQQKEAELAAAAAAQQQQQNAAAAAQAQQQQQFYNDRMLHPAAMTSAGMQMISHSGYPPSATYPSQPGIPAVPPQYPGYPQGANQQQQQQLQQQQQQALWHQQQRMIYQQQHGQTAAGPPGQTWPGQRGPPVPYPTPMDAMQCGPGSVHPTVSQRTSGSGEYSRDGTSPATPHQFNPGSHQGVLMGHAGTPMSRADSQGSMFGNTSYSQQPPSAQQSVESEHPVDKLFTAHDDQLADLGDLDDIEPMLDLGVGVLDDLTANAQADALGGLGAQVGGSLSVDPSSTSAQASNGDRIDSSIASVVEMVSKSGGAPSICGAPAVSQTGTHPSVAGNAATVKRRPSNAQMAANIVAVAGQQQQLITGYYSLRGEQQLSYTRGFDGVWVKKFGYI
ncbi:unnamed protein product [Strongylus vulgaris]|uniref:Uncharacterized protein n=1 Tax=Strongylus vulgaris TaxID=40348 RepID=A0A3P7KBC2_STRVU|nr:unnamed protein product [Strongylus vulgaris]